MALISVFSACGTGDTGGGETVVRNVRNWQEAQTYLRELMSGAKASEFKVAEAASPRVVALVEDGRELAALGEEVKELPDWGCNILDSLQKLPDHESLEPVEPDASEALYVKGGARQFAREHGDLLEPDEATMDDIIERASQFGQSDLAGLVGVACAGKDI